MQELHELVGKLISIPSVNPMGRPLSGPEFLETQLSKFLEEWLSKLDVEVVRQPVSPGRDNILATYRAPNARQHVLLEVHQDTVPVDGMEIEPFKPKIEGGRIYGRGACDNKGPMAAMMMAFKRLAAERPANASSVTLALTVDEEFTFTGASKLVEKPMDWNCAIVAEPTDLDIVNAHKGVVRWSIVTRGRACHSSAPEAGINAIYRMARVLQCLDEFVGELRVRTTDLELGSPSLSVGLIEGGVSVNTVPDFCRIEVDRRLVPGEDPDDAHEEVARLLDSDSSIDFEVECRDPWLLSRPLDRRNNGKLTRQFSRSVGEFRPQHQVRSVSFGTDAAPIAAAGIPSIVFGPGSVDQAHTKDEWIPLDEVELASQIYFHFCSTSGQPLGLA